MGIKLIEPCSENTEQISIPVNSQETSFSNRFDLKAIQSSTMANVSSSSSPRSVSSAVNSDTSLSPKLQVGDGENDVDDKSPILSGDFRELHVEKMERFKKYEDEYTTRLMAKYFSKKNIYGGNIFDENITIDDELIKSSRWPCTRSYADPVQAFEDHNSNDSASVSDTPLIISNGKHQPKKSG